MCNTENIIPSDPHYCKSKKHVREHVQATKEANLYSTHAMECPRSSKRETLLETFISIEEYQMNMEVM